MYGGDALARVDGRVLLAPYLLPGETARLDVEAEGKQMLRGRDAEVLAPSPDRVEPPCPYFYRCGGCQYQHGRYELQVAQKAEILREQIRRVGRIAYDGPIKTICGPDLGYRNRTQFHIDGRQIGYFSEGTHSLVAIDHCPISSPRINETLNAMLAMTRESRWPQFLRSVEVFTNETDVLLNVLDAERPVARRFFEWCAEAIPGFAAAGIEYASAADQFRVSPQSFFQVNRFLVDHLAAAAAEGAHGGTALDLYAGVGLFSIRLARQFRSVTAVESGRGAVQDLQFNATRAGVTIEAVQADVEHYLAGIETPPDFVLADPPRSGLGKRVAAALARIAPPRIRIVSCDPSTLARDVSALLHSGYNFAELTMIDLFPHTYHIEAIATLERNAR